MNIQHPTSNIQRSTKAQAPNRRSGARSTLVYPEVSPSSWTLNETESNGHHPFDLQERTAQFGEAIVRFCKQVPRDSTTDPLKIQLVRCGTSVGANYIEANESFS